MANKKFWYARHWADYQVKTKHLTFAQHGAYILLLDYYYSRNGDVVANATDLLRICSSRTKEEDAAIIFILDNFFSVKDGKYINSRADREMKIARKVSAVRKVAGSKGGSKKVANRVAKGYTVTVTDTTTLSTKESTKEKATCLSKDFNLPHAWQFWFFEQRPDSNSKELETIFETFKDYWIAKPKDNKKLDWFATWRNWVRRDKSFNPKKKEKFDVFSHIEEKSHGQRQSEKDVTNNVVES